jgi:hypothetical protein
MSEHWVMAENGLIGNWRLLSLQFEYADSNERADMYGENPAGYLMIAPGGRMMTIITRSDRAEPAGDADELYLFRTMMGYAGAYRVEGDKLFITTPDVSWHPNWLRKEQSRYFSIDGDILSITTGEQSHPMFKSRKGRGVLRWRREPG